MFTVTKKFKNRTKNSPPVIPLAKKTSTNDMSFTTLDFFCAYPSISFIYFPKIALLRKHCVVISPPPPLTTVQGCLGHPSKDRAFETTFLTKQKRY